jgi:hypothetical protein
MPGASAPMTLQSTQKQRRSGATSRIESLLVKSRSGRYPQRRPLPRGAAARGGPLPAGGRCPRGAAARGGLLPAGGCYPQGFRL